MQSQNSMEEHISKKRIKIEAVDEGEEIEELQMEDDFIALHQQNYHHAVTRKGMQNPAAAACFGGARVSLDKEKKKVKYRYVTEHTSSSRRCHCCKRSGKYRVIECSICKNIRYCHKCIRTWYPGKAEESFYEACPVCQNNCNCESCSGRPSNLKDLKLELVEDEKLQDPNFSQDQKLQDLKFSQDEKLQYSLYIIHTLLPLLQRFNEEQILELDIEAKIQGLLIEEIKLQKAECMDDERINCNYCRTSIADFHRCCSCCSYELCLTCCKEFRKSKFQEDEALKHLIGVDETGMCKEDGDIDFCNGGPMKPKKVSKLTTIYRTLEIGIIPCPGRDGHCCGTMQLKCIYSENWVTGLYRKAEQIAKDHTLRNLPEKSISMSNCNGQNVFHKAASREDGEDNYLYCPTAEDIQRSDLKKFQCHLLNGEPMIIRNVLEARRNVSWDPMVIWHACRESMLCMNVIDCLSWSQVKISPRHFFTGYKKGKFYPYGWPQLLKSYEWPHLNLFEECLPRHLDQYLSCLPFQEVTHLRSGYLNLVSKLPKKSLKPAVGPKTFIAYGLSQELGLGDSVTKLQYVTADVVYVLMHAEAVSLTAGQLSAIHKRKLELVAQSEKEFSGNKKRGTLQVKKRKCLSYIGSEITTKKFLEVSKFSTVEMLGNAEDFENANSRRLHCQLNNMRSQNKRRQNRIVPSSANAFQGCEDEEGAALWDTFRRQDVPQLKEYLRLHYKEFTHTNRSPLQQVFDPIHDQTFYLTMEHKRRLKEEYGIEPWTFTQKLGEAVVIPAGCPYQIRNLKSCVNVALEFVSPENASESLRLTEELRALPDNHIAKEDKLEVSKMILHAMSSAIEDFENLSRLELEVLAEDSPSMGPGSDAKFASKSYLPLHDQADERFCMSTSGRAGKSGKSLSTSSQDGQIDVGRVESTLQRAQFLVPNSNQGSTSASKPVDDSCKNTSPRLLAKEIWEDFMSHPLKVFGNQNNEMTTMHAISELIKNLALFNDKEAALLIEHKDIISSILQERDNKAQIQQEMADLEESENLINILRNSVLKLKAKYNKLERHKQELEAKMQMISEKMREESARAEEIVSMAEGKRSNLETARLKMAKAESEIDSLISRSFAIRSQFRRSA